MNRLFPITLLALAFACTPSEDTDAVDSDDTGDTGGVPTECASEASYDGNADGVAETVTRVVYDSSDRVTQATIDGSDGTMPDGTPESSTNNTYDARGNLVETSGSSTYEGVTYIYSMTMTYDQADRLLKAEDDMDGDGVVDSVTSYTYDDSGNLVESVSDWEADGVVDMRETRFYDEGGNLVEVSADTDGDGTVDSVTTYLYDDAGLISEEQFDYDADGLADQTNTHTYDESGNEVRLTQDLTGEDFDMLTERTFDERGNVITERWSSPASGASSVVNTWDVNDLQLTADYDFDDSGTVDSRSAWEYDSSERVLIFVQDTNADGAADEVTTWLWGC
jgi:hypothetical protein